MTITNMEPPQSDLQRLLGLINQLGKISSRIADISQPLRELLHVYVKDEPGRGVQNKKNSFSDMATPTVLSLYNPQSDTKVSADASSFDRGAVLLQCNGQEWKPVPYVSRTLSETEMRYAQIKKEALATTWACENFSTYRVYANRTHDPITARKFNSRNFLYSEATVCNSAKVRLLRMLKLRAARLNHTCLVMNRSGSLALSLGLVASYS